MRPALPIRCLASIGSQGLKKAPASRHCRRLGWKGVVGQDTSSPSSTLRSAIGLSNRFPAHRASSSLTCLLHQAVNIADAGLFWAFAIDLEIASLQLFELSLSKSAGLCSASGFRWKVREHPFGVRSG
jgi:hypothetical protein